jgi:hypothetical protein
MMIAGIGVNMGRRRRRCHLLEITSITAVPGSALIFNVQPVNLNDGDNYRLVLSSNLAFPNNLTGTEVVQVQIGPPATPPTALIIPLGDWRARVVRSERVRRDEVICMVYTVDSLAGIVIEDVSASLSVATVTTAVPAFIVLEGIAPIR